VKRRVGCQHCKTPRRGHTGKRGEGAKVWWDEAKTTLVSKEVATRYRREKREVLCWGGRGGCGKKGEAQWEDELRNEGGDAHRGGERKV